MFYTDNDIHNFLKKNRNTCGDFHHEVLQQVLDAVAHVTYNNIKGDFIEIGVYKGIMIMAMCAKLLQLGVSDRIIHLYDTFEGMSDPSIKDIQCHSGCKPDMNLVKCFFPLDRVKYNIELVGYPSKNIYYHVGDICKTHVEEIPKRIAFLRLDTDWYESTKFELEYFAPNVENNGIITQDDYNWWKGATDAVNEYLSTYTRVSNYMNPNGIWWTELKTSA